MNEPPHPHALRQSGENTPVQGFRYDAFISYSRGDTGFATALEQALEKYKPPKGIGPDRRLMVFRDTEDLTGTEYGAAIERSLTESRKLILLCSPSARASKWVGDEIRRFLQLRPASDVIPLLVQGIPNNEGEANDERHAFHDALTEALDIPLATSFVGFDPEAGHRLGKDQFTGAWYAVLANMLDVTREDIEQRDRLANARTLRRVIAGAGAVITVLIGLTTWALFSAAGQKRARFDADARALEARSMQATVIPVPSLEDPVAAMLLAREALLLAQNAEPGKRMPGAESVMRQVAATLPGLGLVGYQQPIPSQANLTPWTVLSPDGRWLVTGHREVPEARVWDLHDPRPEASSVLLEQTSGAYLLGQKLIVEGPRGLRAYTPGQWDSPTRLAGLPYNYILQFFERSPTSAVAWTGPDLWLLDDHGDSISVTPVRTAESRLSMTLLDDRWMVGGPQEQLWVADLETPDAEPLLGQAARAHLLDLGHRWIAAPGRLWSRVRFGVVDVGNTNLYENVVGGALTADGRYLVKPVRFDSYERSPVVVQAMSGGDTWSLPEALTPITVAGEFIFTGHASGGLAVWRISQDSPELMRYWPDLPSDIWVSANLTWLVTSAPPPGTDPEEPDGGRRTLTLHRFSPELTLGPGFPLATLTTSQYSGAIEVAFTPDDRWIILPGVRTHRLLDIPSALGGDKYVDPIATTTWVGDADVLYTAHLSGVVRRWEPNEDGSGKASQVFAADFELVSLVVSEDENWVLGEPAAGGLELWSRGEGGFKRVQAFSVTPSLYWDLSWEPDESSFRSQWFKLGYMLGSGGFPLTGGMRAARTPPLRFDGERRALEGSLKDGTTVRWSLDDPSEPTISGVSERGPTVPRNWNWTPLGADSILVSEWVPQDTISASANEASSEPLRFPGSWMRFSPDGRYGINGCDVEDPKDNLPAFSASGRWWVTTLGIWRVDEEGFAAIRDTEGISPPPASDLLDLDCLVWSLEEPDAPPLRLTPSHSIEWPEVGGGGLVSGFAFSPDERWLLIRHSYRGFGSCGYGGDYRLMDLQDPDPLTTYAPLGNGELPSTGCSWIQFSPGSNWLATDNLLWDLRATPPTAQSVPLRGSILSFDPEGHYVAVEVSLGSEQDPAWAIEFISLEIEDFALEICRKAGRNLSAAEWRAAFPGQPYRALCPALPVPEGS
jgi:TIR domain